MTEFSIGDRVQLHSLPKFNFGMDLEGWEGTVVELRTDGSYRVTLDKADAEGRRYCVLHAKSLRRVVVSANRCSICGEIIENGHGHTVDYTAPNHRLTQEVKMTQDERIAYALRIVEQAGMLLEWKYDEYADQLVVTLALPEKPSPVEAFKLLRSGPRDPQWTKDEVEQLKNTRATHMMNVIKPRRS